MKRSIDAPEGCATRRTILEHTGLTEIQFHQLGLAKIVEPVARNGANYALYPDTVIAEINAMKVDGRLQAFLKKQKPVGLAPLVASTQKVAAYYTPDEGIRVFELLAEGNMRLEQIIIHLARSENMSIHPLVARKIHEDYVDMTRAILLDRQTIDNLNRRKDLPGNYPIETRADIVEVIEECLKVRTCTTCRQSAAADLCEGCIAKDRRLAVNQARHQQMAAAAAATRAAAGTSAPERPLAPAAQKVDDFLDEVLGPGNEPGVPMPMPRPRSADEDPAARGVDPLDAILGPPRPPRKPSEAATAAATKRAATSAAAGASPPPVPAPPSAPSETATSAQEITPPVAVGES